MSDAPQSGAPQPDAPQHDKRELKAAMKAFRKRLKLTVLDDQSRISVAPTSSGGNSSIVAITPPDSFPDSVWQELARQGRLRHVGDGMYELRD